MDGSPDVGLNSDQTGDVLLLTVGLPTTDVSVTSRHVDHKCSSALEIERSSVSFARRDGCRGLAHQTL